MSRVGAQFARGGDEKMKRLLEREAFYTPPETSIDYSFLTSPPLCWFTSVTETH